MGSRATAAEGEPTLAVDPVDRRDLVAAWQQDVQSQGTPAIRAAVSEDGGRSWRGEAVPGSGPCDGGDRQYPHVTDVWAAFSADGVAWLSALPFTDANPGAVSVHRSSDGGRSFGGPRFVDRDQTPLSFDDKESIAADPRDPRKAYVTWLKQQRLPAPLPGVPVLSQTLFSRTTDGGQSWSAPRVIATSSPGRAFAGGIVAVRPTGQLLLAWPQITPDNLLACVADEECAGEDTVKVVRSSDGGATWSPPVVAARLHRAPVHDGEGDEIKASADQFSLAIAPDGDAYLTAHDERDAPNSHILVVRSTDGGATWLPLTDADSSSPARGPKLQPTIAAGPHSVAIVYYDFRDDTSRDGVAQFSWWSAHSEDHGQTWHEQRLTGPSDLRAAPGTPEAFGHFIGDYFALEPVGRAFIAAITVARPLARQGPTDVVSVTLTPHRRRTSRHAPTLRHRPWASPLPGPPLGGLPE